MIEHLKDLPFYQWLAIAGTLLLFGSGGIEFMGITVPMVNSTHSAGLGVGLLVMAGVTNLINKQLEFKRQKLDAEIRMKKMDHGHPPENDKTVIRAPE